jgi:hypothetical protein
MQKVVIRYTGVFSRSTFNVMGDVENTQIVVIDSASGKEEIVLTGDKYSSEEYEKLGGKGEETQFFIGLGR